MGIKRYKPGQGSLDGEQESYPKLRSILEVEREAMRWAVLNAVNFGYDNIIFETDS